MIGSHLSIAVLSLATVRAVGFAVFLAWYLRERSARQLLIAVAWLMYSVAAVLTVTVAPPGYVFAPYASALAFAAATTLLVAATSYLYPRVLNALPSFIALMLLLILPGLRLSSGSTYSTYFLSLQALTLLVAGIVLWFERQAARRAIGGAYYGVVCVVVLSLVQIALLSTSRMAALHSIPANGAVSLVLVVALVHAEHYGRLNQLRQSASRLAQAESLARIGYWERNVVTEEAYWSVGHYRIYGLPEGTPVPSSAELNERIHPEDRERVKELYKRIRGGSPYETSEFRILLPNGDVRWIRSCTTQQEGAEHWAFGVVQDISEMKGPIAQPQ